MKDISFGFQFQVMVTWADQDGRTCVEYCLVHLIAEPCIRKICPYPPTPVFISL